jgi:hypothetical protein
MMSTTCDWSTGQPAPMPPAFDRSDASTAGSGHAQRPGRLAVLEGQGIRAEVTLPDRYRRAGSLRPCISPRPPTRARTWCARRCTATSERASPAQRPVALVKVVVGQLLSAVVVGQLWQVLDRIALAVARFLSLGCRKLGVDKA